MSRILWKVIAQFPEKKQSVMKMRAEGFTLKEVGDAKGMTAKQVSMIEADARRRIRSAPEGKILRKYYVQYI